MTKTKSVKKIVQPKPHSSSRTKTAKTAATKGEVNPKRLTIESPRPAFVFRFTPSLMPKESLERIFVQRQAILERVVELISESVLKKSKHQTLLIGPRGIGKTHFVSMAYHRIHDMNDLRDRLVIAWLQEDEWGITSFLDLLLRIFRAIKDEYNDKKLAEQVEALYKLPTNEIESAAADLLIRYIGKRTLFVIIENLDDVFQGLGDEGQKRFRSFIQENRFLTILATSQSLFSGVSLQTSPFYGFFRIQHLAPLSLEDAVQLLTNLAEYRGDAELAAFIQSPTGRARIRAVNHLAGGNHRVYIIFSQFITRESLDELTTPFMQMLDDLTPYYQERMRWLSPQQRKIVEFLINRRGAVTVKEIAERCFMTHQTASSQLKSLREMQYVQSTQIGRESYYELSEPLMRLCVDVKNNKGKPIQLFIDFLRLWYSKMELQQRLEGLKPEAKLEREYLLYTLEIIELEEQDPRLELCLESAIHSLEEGDFYNLLKVAEEILVITNFAWALSVMNICKRKLEQEKEQLKRSPLKKQVDAASTLAFRGMILTRLKHYDKAIITFKATAEKDGLYKIANLFWAEALIARNHWTEGFDKLDNALQSHSEISLEIILTAGHIMHFLMTSSLSNQKKYIYAENLVRIFEKNNSLKALVIALIMSIPQGGFPESAIKDAKKWRALWGHIVNKYQDFNMALRLLEFSVRYSETTDKRVLLELPVEERELLESLLKIQERPKE